MVHFTTYKVPGHFQFKRLLTNLFILSESHQDVQILLCCKWNVSYNFFLILTTKHWRTFC